MLTTGLKRIGTSGCSVHVVGEIDVSTVPKLRASLGHAIHLADVDIVVLDLADVTLLDASGIGLLIQCKQELNRAGKAFRVVGAHGIVARVLELTRVDEYLGVELSRPEVLT